MRYTLLFCALLAGCDSFGPSELGAVRFDPPPSYRMDWGKAEQCSGQQGRFSDVAFYVVPDSLGFDTPKGRALAYYTDSPQTITVAGGWLMDGLVLRHEMLHALGFNDHDDPVFAACGARPDDWTPGSDPLELPPSLQQYVPF